MTGTWQTKVFLNPFNLSISENKLDFFECGSRERREIRDKEKGKAFERIKGLIVVLVVLVVSHVENKKKSEKLSSDNNKNKDFTTL